MGGRGRITGERLGMGWDEKKERRISSAALFWMVEYPEDSLSHFLSAF